MIRTNEFMRSYDTSKMSKRDYWMVRQQYENLSKKEKRKYDRAFVKLKQSFSFEEWWEYVGGRVKDGRQKHIRDLNRPYLKNTHIEKLKNQLNDPEYRKYHHLKPLEEND